MKEPANSSRVHRLQKARRRLLGSAARTNAKDFPPDQGAALGGHSSQGRRWGRLSALAVVIVVAVLIAITVRSSLQHDAPPTDSIRILARTVNEDGCSVRPSRVSAGLYGVEVIASREVVRVHIERSTGGLVFDRQVGEASASSSSRPDQRAVRLAPGEYMVICTSSQGEAHVGSLTASSP